MNALVCGIQNSLQSLVGRAGFVVGLLALDGKDSLRLSFGWNSTSVHYLYFISPQAQGAMGSSSVMLDSSYILLSRATVATCQFVDQLLFLFSALLAVLMAMITVWSYCNLCLYTVDKTICQSTSFHSVSISCFFHLLSTLYWKVSHSLTFC